MKTDNALGYCHWCVGISMLKTRGKVSECRTVSGWLSMTVYTGNSMSLKQRKHGLKYFSDLLVPYSKCKTPKTANQNTEHSHLMKAWNKLVEYSSLLGSWCPEFMHFSLRPWETLQQWILQQPSTVWQVCYVCCYDGWWTIANQHKSNKLNYLAPNWWPKQ